MSHLKLQPALLLVIALAGPAWAQGELFDMSKTRLDPVEAPKLGALLVVYAQAQAAASADFHATGPYRKLVRIAYQLAPRNTAVAACHERIRNGQPPEPPPHSVRKEDVVAGLVDQITRVSDSTNRDDAIAAHLLATIGALIDDSNSTFHNELQKFKAITDEGWSQILAVYARKIPDGMFSTIKGLTVMSTGTAEVGQVSRILLTFKANNQPGLTATLLRERGEQIHVSAQEAIRYWDRIRQGVPLPGGTVEISFEDKFTKKDGPSAAAAYAVLLRSFSDPFKVDEAAALTGDVSVEGRILPVGGIYAKLRGAANGGCRRVGIPESNESDLTDALVLNDPSNIVDLEIFALGTVDDAVAMMRADQTEKAKKASADYDTLRDLVKQKLGGKGGDPALAASIQKLAEGILASNPRHLSAKIIDLWNRGKLVRRLTLASSLDEAHDVVLAYLTPIQRGRKPSFADVMNETRTAAVSATVDKIKALIPKLHLDAQKPAEELEACFTSLQRFVYLRPDHDKKLKKVQELDEEIRELQRKLTRSRDKDEKERLGRKIKQAESDRNDAVDAANKVGNERKDHFEKAMGRYENFVTMVRSLIQDPKVLEKLIYGK